MGQQRGAICIQKITNQVTKAVVSVAENAVDLMESMKQIQDETEVNREISAKLNSEVDCFKRV